MFNLVSEIYPYRVNRKNGWILIQGKTNVIYGHKSPSEGLHLKQEKLYIENWTNYCFMFFLFFFFWRKLSYIYCTKMYPMALMCLYPLSGETPASLPHEFESSGLPPVPNPILELHLEQASSLLLTIPILALEF